MVSIIRAYASPKKGWNQMSGRVTFPAGWHARPVANAPGKPLVIQKRVKLGIHKKIGIKSDRLGCNWNWSSFRMSFNIRERTLHIV